ncbi:MAG TPA: MFS transporter [Xanthobacteraceae bacterium]|nr:MFS transporter [Xanthobacteraceae bacterium]
MTFPASPNGSPVGRLIKLMSLLWLAGVAMRMTILAMPPVIPLIHRELDMSETQVGLLIGLPLALFAIAAIPGSLLIARVGTRAAAVIGMIIAALAGAARSAAVDVWTLYAAAIATGFGVAIMQPGMPTLVREWLPSRIALGTIAYTSGMLMGTLFATGLTIPLVLPLVGGSWRLDLLVWAVPALLIAPVFLMLSPTTDDASRIGNKIGALWWPNFKDPLVWLLGLTFGSNNSPFFGTNAFLGDYLASQGKADLLGAALGWLNGAQIVAPIVLLFMANRLQGRAWPFLLFGPVLLAAFLGLIFSHSAVVILVCAALVGFTTAITLTATLALPPLLSSPGDLARTSAGMFTVSYATAIIIPTISGALWDATGRPWTAFVPLSVCAVTLTVFGTIATRYPPATGS